MKNIKSHFEMHVRFRNGIFLLAIIITILIGLFFFVPFTDRNALGLQELSEFQHYVDSLKLKKESDKNSYVTKPFNPNFITEYKAYVLGMSSEQFEKLRQYRAQEKWINSVDDFQKVTGISDSLSLGIAPLLKFPVWTRKNERNRLSKKTKYRNKTFDQKGDLNDISLEELQSEIGMPDFIAERIVKYRIKIGGFIDDIQLLDIPGLYENQRNKLVSLYTVKNKPKISKININGASVKQLLEVPYFDFETALAIKDFINQKGAVLNLRELAKIEGFPLEKIDRIALYLMCK